MKVIFSGYKTPVIFWGGINGQEHAGLAILLRERSPNVEATDRNVVQSCKL